MSITLHKRIKLKLILVLLTAIIPLVLFIFYLFDLWYDTSKSLVFQENLAAAKLTSTIIQESFSKASSAAVMLADNPDFVIKLTKNKQEAKSYLKNIIENNPEYSSILVFDKEGKIITGSLDITDEQENTVNISDWEYFKTVITTKKAFIGTPIIGRFKKAFVIPVVQPIIKNDEVEKLIVVSYRVSDLKERIKKSINNHNKTVIILDAKGEIVFVTNKDLLDEKTTSLLKDSDCFYEAQKGNDHLIDNKYLPFLDQRVIGASTPIINYNWVVISIVPINYVFIQLTKVQNVIWLILFAAIVFALSLISYFIRKIRIIVS